MRPLLGVDLRRLHLELGIGLVHHLVGDQLLGVHPLVALVERASVIWRSASARARSQRAPLQRGLGLAVPASRRVESMRAST